MKPILSSAQLDAFVAVAEARHFTRAAKSIGLTQSALSQRILNLETELGAPLLVRSSVGVELTQAGARLLHYAKTRQSLERELLSEIAHEAYPNLLRLAGYSSIMRSAIVPALGPLVRGDKPIELELLTREMRELVPLLLDGKTDYIVLDRVHSAPRVSHVSLGTEENVLVESTRKDARRDVYLDHDQDDPTTEMFFVHNKSKERAARRAFLDDIDGIVTAVQSGYGRAVVPLHLAKSMRGVRLVRGLSSMKNPVVLHYLERNPSTRFHEGVVQALVRGVGPALRASPSPVV
jgi:DNA-binding transcriptional LysR family regulator